MGKISLYLALLTAAGCGGEKLGARDLSGVADLSIPSDLAGTHCADDTNCGGPTPRCDQNVGHCVPCLPMNDNCPDGQACTDATGAWACSDTCHVNADCGKLGMAGACCANVCIDPATSPKNCGTCGNACPGAANAMGGCANGACVLACDPGFGDCDQLPGNGCETSTDTDAKNCGVCGKLCPSASNAKASCDKGACAAACTFGFFDCNKNPQDGCETDGTGDANNCGGCGTICKVPANAVPFCNQSVCSFQCKLGYLDCDGNTQNGCEVDGGIDPKNCGHCGNACPVLPNASGGCTDGQCGAGQCDNGFGDCDKNAMNGCESKTDTDLANCGGCGKGCKAANGGAMCANGSCTLTCNQGFQDCNQDGRDGCEANLLFDGKNCNGCGNVCPMNTPSCNNGVCSVGRLHWQLVEPSACNAWCGGQGGNFTCTNGWNCDMAHLNGYLWIYSASQVEPPLNVVANGYGWVSWFCGTLGCAGPGPNAGNCGGGGSNTVWQCVFN